MKTILLFLSIALYLSSCVRKSKYDHAIQDLKKDDTLLMMYRALYLNPPKMQDGVGSPICDTIPVLDNGSKIRLSTELIGWDTGSNRIHIFYWDSVRNEWRKIKYISTKGQSQ